MEVWNLHTDEVKSCEESLFVFTCVPSVPTLQELISESYKQTVHSFPVKALLGATVHTQCSTQIQHKRKTWCCIDTWLRRAKPNQNPPIARSYNVIKMHTRMQTHTRDILPLERSWNLSLVFFFLHFQGLNSFPSDDSLPRCCRDAGAFWVFVALSTTTSQLASDDDFSNPSTRRHAKI